MFGLLGYSIISLYSKTPVHLKLKMHLEKEFQSGQNLHELLQTLPD